MATGRSTQLTGQVGEYLVAATFSGNVEHFDILASDLKGVAFAVQVKAIRTGDWQLSASRFPDIEIQGTKQVVRGSMPEPHPGLICVFVLLGSECGADEFYVLTWLEVQKDDA